MRRLGHGYEGHVRVQVEQQDMSVRGRSYEPAWPRKRGTCTSTSRTTGHERARPLASAGLATETSVITKERLFGAVRVEKPDE